jgi:hypothetical protein
LDYCVQIKAGFASAIARKGIVSMTRRSVHAISVVIIPIYGKGQGIVFRPINRQTDRWKGAGESESASWVTHLHCMPVSEVGKAAKLRQPDTLSGGSVVFFVSHN